MHPDPARNLVARLHYVVTAKQQQLCILFGSGATTPFVPGVPELTANARRYAERHTNLVKAPTAHAEGVSSDIRPSGIQGEQVREYSEALQWVQQVRGADGVRAVVQEAALRARTSPIEWTADNGPLLDNVFREWEHQVDAWQLPEGLQSLAEIIKAHNQSISRYVFTTNFDPLIEIAIRRAGTETRTMAIEHDHAAPFGYRPGSATEKIVVHLHGDCYGRTQHTPWALGRRRPELESWISSLLDNQLLLVVGYSGWDDIIHRVLEEKLKSFPAFEVLWAVYEDQEQHRHINPRLEEFFAQNATVVTPYYGVDRDRLFTDVLIDLRPHHESSGGGYRSGGRPSKLYDFARGLNRDHRFGISHLEPESAPTLVFWPHRLRKPHLIHGVHALAAMLLTQLGIPIELYLDDAYLPGQRADQLAREFTDAVTAWFSVCGVSPIPTVTRTSQRFGSTETLEPAVCASLWRLAEEFFGQATTVFDVLLATKTVDPGGQGLIAPGSAARHMLRPLYTWLALERSIQEQELEVRGTCQILTLGGADEQKMWDLWHARASAPPIANLYVPRLETPTAGRSLWEYQELWRDTPFSGVDLERFTQRMAQAGNDGEVILEWFFETAVRLAAAASQHRLGEMRYGDSRIDSWGEALDALRRDPLGAQRALAATVSQWFHAVA